MIPLEKRSTICQGKEKRGWHRGEDATYYRIVSHRDLQRDKKNQEIRPSNEEWDPYPPGKVVMIFETNDVDQLICKYAAPIAETRDEDVRGGLYLLEINDPPGKVSQDRSHDNGWTESRVHCGPIPMRHVKVLRKITIRGKPGNYTIRNIEDYKP